MAQIHVDPARLRDYAGKLTRFAERVGDCTERLNARIYHLSDSWEDQEFERFRHEFEAVQHHLGAFVEEIRDATPLLKRDADEIDEYFRKTIGS